ncbi:MAG: helix-turn-helix domain-containing protein [Syntrophales bacterium]|nr:helix-turn-helix domain-containing protein [Syntrophales bacterium]
MKDKNQKTVPVKEIAATSPHMVVEDIIAEKLEHITTVLCQTHCKKSQLYEEVLTIVERSLFRIALKRNNNIKSRAADYLGISRNTFQNKMVKLGMENHSEP